MKGGILAFDALWLDLDEDIFVDEKGFWGGDGVSLAIPGRQGYSYVRPFQAADLAPRQVAV